MVSNNFNYCMVTYHLKQILNLKYKFNNINIFINIYIITNLINSSKLFLQAYNPANISPIIYIPLVIINAIYPIIAILFYFHIFKSKNLWLKIFALIGLLISITDLLQQGLIILMATNIIKIPQFVNTYMAYTLVGGTLTTYFKMIQSIILGAIVINKS